VRSELVPQNIGCCRRDVTLTSVIIAGFIYLLIYLLVVCDTQYLSLCNLEWQDE